MKFFLLGYSYVDADDGDDSHKIKILVGKNHDEYIYWLLYFFSAAVCTNEC